jgi:hypothetical protein
MRTQHSSPPEEEQEAETRLGPHQTLNLLVHLDLELIAFRTVRSKSVLYKLPCLKYFVIAVYELTNKHSNYEIPSLRMKSRLLTSANWCVSYLKTNSTGFVLFFNSGGLYYCLTISYI